ncbi:MAG: GTP 3',8-cyclase MoaA [bacterium]|nr:GTP 3',8-cyclase MoaA [bacterium]
MHPPTPPTSTPPTARVVADRHGRALRNLRISVTDRCNLRCGYCMPEEEYVWLPKSRVLTFEEIERLVSAFTEIGVDRVRLTGGEPLLRRDLHKLVARLARHPRLREVALTTNALLLTEQAPELRAAGLSRITVSLDSLDPNRFHDMTRRNELGRALAGVEAASRAGFAPIKINTVLMAGVNDKELDALLDFARSGGHELRFIEYMDVGGATRWSPDVVVDRDEILARVAARHGTPRPLAGRGSAPADRYTLPDGTVFGVIASTTAPFCGACDRARLTADGHFYACLYAKKGFDLATALREGATDAELLEVLRGNWRARSDRGAEERLGLADRTPLAGRAELADDPRLEMHTRGG